MAFPLCVSRVLFAGFCFCCMLLLCVGLLMILFCCKCDYCVVVCVMCVCLCVVCYVFGSLIVFCVFASMLC